MSTVKTAEEIGKLHALCEKAFADESGYGEVHSLSDRGIYRTFRDGFFAANRVLGKELRAELAELRAREAAASEQKSIGILQLIDGQLVPEFVRFAKDKPELFAGESLYVRNVPPAAAAAVPDDVSTAVGWKLVFAPFDSSGNRVCPYCGCRTNANAMQCCRRAAAECLKKTPSAVPHDVAKDAALKLVSELQTLSEAAYGEYVSVTQNTECLGWKSKINAGTFGESELKAHRTADNWLGKHRAYSDAATKLAAILAAKEKGQ